MNPREWIYCPRGCDGVELLEAAFDRHVYDRHIHGTYAIGVTLRGVQRFWCRGATHDSTPGHVIIINPGDAHDGRSGAPGGYAYRMFYVRIDVLQSLLAEVWGHHARMGAAHPLVYDPRLARLIAAGWKASASAPGSLAADELFDRCMRTVAAQYVGQPRAVRASRHDRVLRQIRDLLHDRVDRSVTLRELSAISSLSRFQLTRLFENAYGVPLHAYHLHVRLEEAKLRLRSGQSIATVASDLGFVDQSHFHRRFRGWFGMTPGQWRSAHGYKTGAGAPAYHAREERYGAGRRGFEAI